MPRRYAARGRRGARRLGAALVLINRTTLALDRQWRRVAQERVATETLDNAMEIATSLTWDELTNEGLSILSPPEHAQRLLARRDSTST